MKTSSKIQQSIANSVYTKLSERNQVEPNFVDWLSSKLGKKITKVLGKGTQGVILDMGYNVLKISNAPFNNLEPIFNKNIEGIAKVFAHGTIKIPQQFLVGVDSFGHESDRKMVNIAGVTLSPRSGNDGNLFYLIMEKLHDGNDTAWNLEMISDSVGRYLWMQDRNSRADGISFLSNMSTDPEVLQPVYDHVEKDLSEDQASLMVEWIVSLRNVFKIFNWKDAHVNQFALNSKGQLVAFDFDNPKEGVSDFNKHMVSEALNESQEDSFVAFHGSEYDFPKFTDEFVGQVDNEAQEGSGIYFTTSIDNARMFGENIYKVEISGRFTSRQNPTSDVDVEKVIELIKLSQEWEMSAQNWSEDPEQGAYISAESNIKYSKDEAQVFQKIEGEYFNGDPIEFVRAMSKIGYDGLITTAPSDFVGHKHIIMYNMDAVTIIGRVNRNAIK